MTFYVGQKVVCIKRGSWHSPPTMEEMSGPSFNQICIVRGFDSSILRGLLLEGFDGGVYFDGTERGFDQIRFRPVVEDRKSASFTAGAPKDSEQWDNRRKVHERT